MEGYIFRLYLAAVVGAKGVVQEAAGTLQEDYMAFMEARGASSETHTDDGSALERECAGAMVLPEEDGLGVWYRWTRDPITQLFGDGDQGVCGDPKSSRSETSVPGRFH